MNKKLIGKTITALLIAHFMVGNIWAHGSHKDWKPVSFPEEKAHAPSPVPERVTLTWNDDPATTQAVTWRTDTSVLHGVAEIAIANSNGRAMKTTSITADTRYFHSDINEAHYHSVVFKSLKPDTLYAYRVGDGANWSEFFHFKTAKATEAPFSFIYFGDAQNDIKTHWSRVFREAFRDAPRASFTLHAGDLIGEHSADAEWGDWHGAAGWVNGTLPLIATPGNHEYYDANRGPEEERVWRNSDGDKINVIVEIEEVETESGDLYKVRAHADGDESKRVYLEFDDDETITRVDSGIEELTGFSRMELLGTKFDEKPLKDRIRIEGIETVSNHWRTQFEFPLQDPPKGLEETCYYIDYQGVRFISLDSNQQVEEQVPWLRRALETNPNRWTIVTFHYPVYSPSKNRDKPKMREFWKPLLDEFRVDLVLNGHDHTYARTGDLGSEQKAENIADGFKQPYDPKIGTVYVVSVSGPKMYEITRDNFYKKTIENTQLYQIIDIDGDTLRFRAYKATGELYDSFELQKQRDSANLLVELIPE